MIKRFVNDEFRNSYVPSFGKFFFCLSLLFNLYEIGNQD